MQLPAMRSAKPKRRQSGMAQGQQVGAVASSTTARVASMSISLDFCALGCDALRRWRASEQLRLSVAQSCWRQAGIRPTSFLAETPRRTGVSTVSEIWVEYPESKSSTARVHRSLARWANCAVAVLCCSRRREPELCMALWVRCTRRAPSRSTQLMANNLFVRAIDVCQALTRQSYCLSATAQWGSPSNGCRFAKPAFCR
mmetsp:Transcript_6563/g.16999  ORF Transcript_6563/g.16999 Transcript_6563/m.16999 type:complete len:200 (-) Transcript_6563:120-719(-)